MATTRTLDGPSRFAWTPDDYAQLLASGLFGSAEGLALVDGVVYDRGRPHVWTREEYYRLGAAGLFEGGRVELIDGEIIVSPTPSPPHDGVIGLLRLALAARLPAGCHIREEKGLAITTHRDNDSAPDLAVVEGAIRDYLTLHPTTAWLVVEVSVSTLTRDQTTELRLYACARVPAYWVLDVDGRHLYAYARPSGDGYRERAVYAAGDAVPLPWPGAPIPLADVLP